MTGQRLRTDERDHAEEAGEILLVRKPKGWTSFDVVNRLRGILKVRKAGHAGTLDPMATGLLIVCTGKETKQIDRLQAGEKEYDVTIVLGARTASFDAETGIIERRSIEGITEDRVREVLQSFVGSQIQLPPMWSAAKVSGKRLYKYARRGETIDRKPREVLVRAIIPKDIALPEVRFTIVCSKGTYVRSLVDDIGLRLGCGAYVSALERTRSGEFLLSRALTIEEIAARHQNSSRRSL